MPASAPVLAQFIKPLLCLVPIHTHTRLTALCPGLPGWAGTRKIKPVWILLEQETVSGSGISWTTCKSALHSEQITTPAPHHSVFYRPDTLPAAQPTVSKHWRDTNNWEINTAKYVDIVSRYCSPQWWSLKSYNVIFNELSSRCCILLLSIFGYPFIRPKI